MLMNRLSPKKLLLTKWTAVTPIAKQKHFLISKVILPEPPCEKIEFVENIMHDLKTLDIKPDHVSHTSDFFPQIVEYMNKMIKDGNAYADCGTAEEMKDQRDNGIESKYR